MQGDRALFWLESVPAGLRWFCSGCDAEVRGLSELDEAEAVSRMVHEDDCEALAVLAALRAVAADGQGTEAKP